MGKKNRNNGNHNQRREQAQQAAENATQGDVIEKQMEPGEINSNEPTVEQVQAAVEQELKAEDKLTGPLTESDLEQALKASIEEPKPTEVKPENKPVEEPPKPVTEVEPAKGLTPEQLEVAKSLVTPKLERYPDRLRKSTQNNPVKMVHAIAETMLKMDPSVRRKDIVNFCVSQGIAFYTARTQVQVFLQAVKRDRENAAKQIAEAATKNSHAA